MAKRNKKTAKVSRSGKSPYQKYGKTPCKYSSSYYEWRASVVRKKEKPEAYKADNRPNKRQMVA